MQSLEKAADSSGEIILGTRYVLRAFYAAYPQAATAFSVQSLQENSAARPAESSKAVLFSPFHIVFSHQLVSFLSGEFARKLLYQFFFPLPSYFAHFSLLMTVSYHTVLPPSIIGPSSSLSPSNIYKHLEPEVYSVFAKFIALVTTNECKTMVHNTCNHPKLFAGQQFLLSLFIEKHSVIKCP